MIPALRVSRSCGAMSICRRMPSDDKLGLEQLIPITGKNLVRGRVPQRKRFRSFEEARRTQLDVIAKARSTYFQLANAYDQLEINSKNLTSLKQIADISRSRYEAGLESAANVLVAETDYSKLQEARRDLERNCLTRSRS